jgi:hypothetical protein
MTPWFVAPAIAALALGTAVPAGSTPIGNAVTSPSTLLSRVEHDHSDGDYSKRDARSDDRRGESDREDRRTVDRADRNEERQDGGERWHGRKGASFWLRSGDLRVGVRCAPSESMRACVDAALLLLDKAKSAQTPGSTSSANTSAPQTR